MIFDKEKVTPMMRQYIDTKEQYNDCILFYRLGDFYEMFFDDAEVASKVLDLTLTKKACGKDLFAPMCGVPYHAADIYIAKLLQEGFKVGICEQMTEPKAGEIVTRDVIRIVTPGTVYEDDILDSKKSNYIASIYKHENCIGVAYADVSTGDLYAIEMTGENCSTELNDFLVRTVPSEIICNTEAREEVMSSFAYKMNNIRKPYQYIDAVYELNNAQQVLKEQFGQTCISIFELNKKPFAISACGALMQYLRETQKSGMSHIRTIKQISNDDYMTIDITSRRNLEIDQTLKDRKKVGSILWLLDNTNTSIGARMFRSWLEQPLKNEKLINQRLDAVEELVDGLHTREKIIQALGGIRDIERICGKISFGSLGPRDCLNLKASLQNIPALKDAIAPCKSKKLFSIYQNIADFSDVVNYLDKCIDNNAPLAQKDGHYIKEGFNSKLDEYRNARNQGNVWLTELEQKEKLSTGIKNLKIGYNRVFGYYIEVNRSQSDLVPIHYIRKQTISNNERYITEDLKKIEDKILGADEKALKLESEIFAELREALLKIVPDLQLLSKLVGEIDCLCSLATVAVKNNYVKPKISSKIDHIKIIEGRHPVVEAMTKDSAFIPNDTYLDSRDDKIMIITGPNMAGKSTYMRQVAVLTFMAHIGSFVPAKSAEFSITDRIFTRVGASDDLAFGQSTFMVEMSEVAHILANATKDSLIILDEIGRGTSTFDGLAIAWAVVESLAKEYQSKTLFATHYHELSELEGMLEGVKNYRISVKEYNNSIIFLRKIVRGGTNKSFGIEVAALAGVKESVISRAKEISHNLEESDLNKNLSLNAINQVQKEKKDNSQKVAKQIFDIVKDLKVEVLTPLDAFDVLCNFVKMTKEN